MIPIDPEKALATATYRDSYAGEITVYLVPFRHYTPAGFKTKYRWVNANGDPRSCAAA